MVHLSKLQHHVFPPNINACVLCVQVLCKTRRSLIYTKFFPILGDTSYLRTSVKGCSKIRRVLATSRLILDEIFRLYRKFVSYLRPISHKMRLIFPRIIGLLSSYIPQILLQIHANLFCPQSFRIIARKYANRLVPHTNVCLNKFLLWNIRNQYKNFVQLFVVLIAYHRTHFLL